jgi:hypothetical protein
MMPIRFGSQAQSAARARAVRTARVASWSITGCR